MMSDKIDLYSDRGVLLKSDIDLAAVSPLKNAAMQRLIALTKRTVVTNHAEDSRANYFERLYGDYISRPAAVSEKRKGFRSRPGKAIKKESWEITAEDRAEVRAEQAAQRAERLQRSRKAAAGGHYR